MTQRMLLVSVCALLPAMLFGQTPTGEITGTVSDSTGGLVGGATVIVTNPATNIQRTVTTNSSGVFDLPSLAPGNYNLRVEAKGFKSELQSNIELQVGQVARLDFTLQVGNVAETIEVQASAPVLETETTALGTVIENRRIVELPLNGRNYLQLASLIPGATTNGPASSQGQQRMGGARNAFALNVSGQRVHYNHYTLDGIENTDPNFNTYLFLPSIDALQEFKVESGTYGVEYGRGMSQVNVTTKSGTNALHGTAFEFLRNSDLDAKNFFDSPAKPIPPFKRNQFGATMGGPVWIPKIINGRNKLFFFFDYEGLRERKALTTNLTLPFASDRTGDFSQSKTIVYDPATRVVDSTGKLISISPFANNIIPPNRIQTISKTVFDKYYPLPNNIQNGSYNNDFLSNEGRRTDSDQYTGRVDYQQSANSSFQVRYSYGTDSLYLPNTAPGLGYVNDVSVHQGMLGHILVLGPNKVNEFKFGISRLVGSNTQQRAFKENVVAALGIPDVSRDFPLYWGVPFFQISNFSSIGECNDCPFVNWDTIFQWTDTFSWTHGTHSLKFGTDDRRTRYNQIGAVVPRGRFTFNGQYSNNPLISTATAPQNAIADFLLGNMSLAEGQVGAPIANFRGYSLNFYAEDTWKVTPKLTVNYGLRYELEPPYLDSHDAIVNIDFRWDNSIVPVYVRAGAGDPYQGNPPFRVTIPYVRDGRFGRRAYKTSYTDWAPRLGVAYSLNSKTVIRTGAGIYYVRDIGNAVFDVVRNAPFTIRRNESPGSAIIPSLTWQRPFTQLGTPTFILANQFNEPSTYVGQWSFGVQRQLTNNMSLETAYLGSAGIHLRRLTSYNDPAPGPPANINARRPQFPIYQGNFQNMNAPSHSNYHALQVRLQQRFSRGFTLLSSYSWSKSIDNGSGIRTSDGDSLLPVNSYDLRTERGLSAFDFRQRWTTSFLYEVPIGRGKALFGDANVFANALLGGWQIGGIFTWQSGFPFTIFCGSGSFQNGGNGCYPDNLGGRSSIDSRGPSLWFNTANFVNRINDPNLPQFRFGNNARNNVIGPGIADLDFSATKTFRFTERMGLEFRSEFFNLPNHPIFGQPNSTIGTGFGTIAGTRIDSRQIQFGLKLIF